MAKRKIQAEKETTIKSPEPPKSQERELDEAMDFMISEMTQRFRNQVFKELNQSTIKKFADAQTGNYAKVYLRLAKKVQRKLLRQFDDKRIEELTDRILNKVNKRNREELYKKVEKRIGLSTKELTATEGLTFQINALTLETAQWVKKLRDETLEMYTANSLRAMSHGESLSDIMEQFEGLAEKRRNHAKFTARNQIANFNSVATKIRSQNLGLTRAKWITSRDERVRRCHQVRNGKEFELDKGLYSSCDQKYLLPGVDYQCFPGSVKINHSSLCKKLYRRWYTGELTEIVRSDGVVLRTTPNHPIFTVSGFKPAGEIDPGENILCTFEQRGHGVELNGDDMIPTLEEFFRAVDLLGVEHRIAPAPRGKFHGDVSDSDVDVVLLDSFLMGEVDALVAQKFYELQLPVTDQMIVFQLFTCLGVLDPGFERLRPATDRIVRTLNLVRSGLLAHFGPLELFRFALGAWANTGIDKPLSDGAAIGSKMFGDSVFAMSALVHGLDFFDRQIQLARSASPAGHGHVNLFQLPGERGRMDPDFSRGVLEQSPGLYKVCSVIDKRSVDFSGHVYNLETVSGDYIANTTAVSNCRCDYELIIPSDDEDQDDGA